MPSESTSLSLILVSIASLILIIPNTDSAFACKCGLPFNAQDELKRSAAVFSGKVTEIHEDALGNRYEVAFHVERSWKGVSGEAVTIFTALESAACGYTFDADEKYLVYAYETEGSLYTTICNGTALLADAQGDLNVLGPTWQIYRTHYEEYTIKIPYRITNGVVKGMEVDLDFTSMIILIDKIRSDGVLTIVVPRNAVDAKFDGGGGDDDEFIVLVDGEEQSYEELDKSLCFRTISIEMPYDAEEIEIIGTETLGYNPVPRIERVDPFYASIYRHGNVINIEGCTNLALDDKEVTLEVLSSEGKVYQASSVPLNFDGTFSGSLI
ncbi:MAG: hypothetical protein ACRD38_09300, partial [Nitrososphaerales archaeon]